MQFRNNECKRIDDSVFGGSGAGDFQLACEVDLTRWRIDWLPATNKIKRQPCNGCRSGEILG